MGLIRNDCYKIQDYSGNKLSVSLEGNYDVVFILYNPGKQPEQKITFLQITEDMPEYKPFLKYLEESELRAFRMNNKNYQPKPYDFDKNCAVFIDEGMRINGAAFMTTSKNDEGILITFNSNEKPQEQGKRISVQVNDCSNRNDNMLAQRLFKDLKEAATEKNPVPKPMRFCF